MSCVISRKSRTMVFSIVVLIGTSGGCGSDVPETTSPVTTAESDEGRKARAEDERLLIERRRQEAKARKRVPGLPVEG